MRKIRMREQRIQMVNYKMTIQYDGGRYKGWQKLGGGENTIQDKLEKVLSGLVDKEVEITGCSRTDAGVHALAQTANFKLDVPLPVSEILKYFNRYLPQDICVTELAPAADNFHARYNAKSKTYLYRIWNREYPNPFMRKYSMHVVKQLDTVKMREAGKYFLGEHDFTAYSNAKSKKKSMVREIYSIEFEEAGGFINIRICGDSFLYNMVRHMVGSLTGVGLGEIEPGDIPAILESKERNRTGDMAEAGGLYLEKIEY